MQMVGHQKINFRHPPGLAAGLGESLQEHAMILVIGEESLSTIPAADDVIHAAGEFEPKPSCHMPEHEQAEVNCQYYGLTPISLPPMPFQNVVGRPRFDITLLACR